MSTLTDLGTCGAFVGSEHRCQGRLLVTEEVGVLVHGECDQCGAEAALPVQRTRSEEGEREEAWWQR